MEQTKSFAEILKVLRNRDYRYSKTYRTKTLDDLKKEYSRHLKSSVSETINGYTYFIVWKNRDGISSYVLHNDVVVTYKWYSFRYLNELKVEARRYINLLIRTNVVEELEKYEEEQIIRKN